MAPWIYLGRYSNSDGILLTSPIFQQNATSGIEIMGSILNSLPLQQWSEESDGMGCEGVCGFHGGRWVEGGRDQGGDRV